MLAAKLYYLDCSIRVCNRQQRREAPVFSGRIWFDSLEQFISIVEQKLQSLVSTVDQMKIWYRKRGGKYCSIHTSEQEFLDTCSNSNIIVSYFLHGPSPSLSAASTEQCSTLAAQEPDNSLDSIVSIVLNLKDTFSTWSGPSQSWIDLAQHYRASGLTGMELTDIPQSYRSLFTIDQGRTVNSVGVNTSSVDNISVSATVPQTVKDTVSQSPTDERAALSKTKIRSVNAATATLPVSVVETGTEMREHNNCDLIANAAQSDSIYQQRPASQPAGPAASAEKSQAPGAADTFDNLQTHKPLERPDSLVRLAIPKVSAKAAYMITGIVYADIQARGGV